MVLTKQCEDQTFIKIFWQEVHFILAHLTGSITGQSAVSCEPAVALQDFQTARTDDDWVRESAITLDILNKRLDVIHLKQLALDVALAWLFSVRAEDRNKLEDCRRKSVGRTAIA